MPGSVRRCWSALRPSSGSTRWPRRTWCGSMSPEGGARGASRDIAPPRARAAHPRPPVDLALRKRIGSGGGRRPEPPRRGGGDHRRPAGDARPRWHWSPRWWCRPGRCRRHWPRRCALGQSVTIKKMRERDAAGWLQLPPPSEGSRSRRRRRLRWSSDSAPMSPRSGKRSINWFPQGTGSPAKEVLDRFRNRPDEPMWHYSDAVAAGKTGDALEGSPTSSPTVTRCSCSVSSRPT